MMSKGDYHVYLQAVLLPQYLLISDLDTQCYDATFCMFTFAVMALKKEHYSINFLHFS